MLNTFSFSDFTVGKSLKQSQNLFVGFIDDGAFQRGEINLSGGLIVMSHALADDGDGDVLAFGGTRP